MPDMTLCTCSDCPQSRNCWRFITQGGEWQSYFYGCPYEEDEDGEWTCLFYIEIQAIEDAV